MLTTKAKISLARAVQAPLMGLRRVVGLGPELVVTRRGIRWGLDLREGIDFSIYLLGAFELATIKAYEPRIPFGGTVLDVGANVGAHTLHMARCVGPGGRVIAFEPTDWAYSKLLKNVSLNPDLASCVQAEQVLLTDDSASAVPLKIFSSWPLEGGKDLHSIHLGRAMPVTKAVVKTLDGFVKEADLGRIDFIKIDVDGAEYSVLSGGMETLRRDLPVIVTELAPYDPNAPGGGIDRLLDLIEAVGYRWSSLVSGKVLPQQRDALKASIPAGAGLNVILTPVGQLSRDSS